jgi:segregation and condensation protein B
MQPDLRDIIESLLFVADEPLAVDRLKSILETVDGREVRAALSRLQEEYDQRGGGFGLFEVAGGWQLRSRPEYQEWIKRLLQPSPQRLSRAALETLALIAYRQPIIRADIEHIRGVDCGGVLRQLMERKLIRVLGRREIPGRPLIYATTRTFLELFDLKDLKDLPSPREIQELGNAFAGAQNRTAIEENPESVSPVPPQAHASDPEPDPSGPADSTTAEPSEVIEDPEHDSATPVTEEWSADAASNISDSFTIQDSDIEDEETRNPE